MAIKVPRQGQLDAQEANRFLQEARTCGQLRHPSIVSVHEVGRQGDTVYIVAEAETRSEIDTLTRQLLELAERL